MHRQEPAVKVNSDPFVDAIRKNIALNEALLSRGETPEIIGTVSGSVAAQKFWQELLETAREPFRARTALSFHEDLPTNQAFGILLLWQRLKPHLQETRGALVSFVFGEGTRSTPFTETDNAQKPAIVTPVRGISDGFGPMRRQILRQLLILLRRWCCAMPPVVLARIIFW